MMHGFRPEPRPISPEFRRREMNGPGAHGPMGPPHDPSFRGPGRGRDVFDRDKLEHEKIRKDDDADRDMDDDHENGDRHEEDEKHDNDQSRRNEGSDKPLSDTRPQELPHHVLPFDWI